MRHVIFFLFLLPVTIVCAQGGYAGEAAQGTRATAPAERTVTLARQMQLKETEVSRLIGYYAEAPAAERETLRPQVYLLLRDLFDLNLGTLEAEMRQLQQQLESLESSQAYEDHSTDIQLLKSTLADVEARLRFRRENRDRIVQQRLRELLD